VKPDREWFRGAHAGYNAAVELLDKYGRSHVQHGADQLLANLRKRSENHTSFDRGYCAAYSEIAYGESPWYRNGAKAGES
jgi:hypothetical protein